MANYSVKVLRLAFGWGRLRGGCSDNPAQGMPLLGRLADAPERNRPGSAEEFAIVCDRASQPLRRALLLAHYAGLRVGDFVAIEWTCWDGGYLSVRQGKTGQLVQVRGRTPSEPVANRTCLTVYLSVSNFVPFQDGRALSA